VILYIIHIMDIDNARALRIANNILPHDVVFPPVFPDAVRRCLQPLYETNMFRLLFSPHPLRFPCCEYDAFRPVNSFKYESVVWYLEKATSITALERAKYGLVLVALDIHYGSVRNAFKHNQPIKILSAYIGLLLRVCVDRFVHVERNCFENQPENERVNAFVHIFAEHFISVHQRSVIRDYDGN